MEDRHKRRSNIYHQKTQDKIQLMIVFFESNGRLMKGMVIGEVANYSTIAL